jgi:CheY-like chemotaxis protein
MDRKRVLSLGQCWADHAAINGMIEQHFQAELVPAEVAKEAIAQLQAGRFDLVLVNRIVDADGASGLEIIKQLKQDSKLGQIPVMLVTNYQQYQQEAMAAGAVPGFGKAQLAQPETIERLRKYLG